MILEEKEEPISLLLGGTTRSNSKTVRGTAGARVEGLDLELRPLPGPSLWVSPEFSYLPFKQDFLAGHAGTHL